MASQGVRTVQQGGTAGGAGPDDEGSMVYVVLICLVAALGGLLFGFDTAVIAGAIGFMKAQFALDALEEGIVTSCVLIGCALGAAMAGVLSDKFGRRNVLLLAAIFFALSSVGAALPRTPWEFVAARLLGGLGIGIASMLSPLYIAEVSPARIRGMLVSANQLAIVTGILVAYMIGWWCAKQFDAETSWRWMFGLGVLPAVLFFICLLFVPESPRWLTKQGHREKALGILGRIGGRAHADFEMREIEAALATEATIMKDAGIRELFAPGLRIALLIGVALAILQQVTGINTVLYYAPEIFKRAGFSIQGALGVSIIVGLVNLVMTVVAMGLIDRLGRKGLLLIGSAGMGVSFGLTGLAFANGWSGTLVLICIFCYVAAFAIAMGPVVWVVLSEIYPTRVRGRAMSIATVILWLSCFAVALTFPTMVARLGDAVTFWFYAAMCVVAFVFVWAMVPETKGKTLEEIERSWFAAKH